LDLAAEVCGCHDKWLICCLVADCCSYSDLVACLQYVIDCLHAGTLQPMVSLLLTFMTFCGDLYYWKVNNVDGTI